MHWSLKIPFLLGLAVTASIHGEDGNRFVHLDEPNNPWQFSRQSPKLVTPQWIGEKGVLAVAVLAIDDMSGDGQRFRSYLSPIISRLQEIDGRGPVSITCNRPKPDHPNMQWFLQQGVSLEAHTTTHPCPLLQKRDFNRAEADFHTCVDLLAKIPNSRTIGFRFGCMDGQNTPSPRAYAEIMNRKSPGGHFVSMSTSVGVVFTPEDKELDRLLFPGELGGGKRFSKYLMTGFVNYLQNYPYPFVVGNKIWELPFVYPNDYTGQALHGRGNPVTIEDFKAALDATVVKKGAVSLCFHAGSWMRSEQMVEIIDHADKTHGKKIKFLNMLEMHDLITKNMLAGHGLRDEEGNDNGVRVLDLDLDGYMDVLIANSKARKCRIWNPGDSSWKEIPFPAAMHPGMRFGFDDENFKTFAFHTDEEGENHAWSLRKDSWVKEDVLTKGLEKVSSQIDGRDGGVRFLDVDHDGTCELIVGNPERSEVYRLRKTGWELLPFSLPSGCSIVTAEGKDAGLRFADLDEDGREDVIFSNSKFFGTWLFQSLEEGWSIRAMGGERENAGTGEDHPRDRKVIPPIVRADGTNNGAWIKRAKLYWQNEDTGHILPHHIDRRSFGDLLGDQDHRPQKPEASLRSMEARPGFAVELVASEPLVMDPVDVAWGPDGKMWVAEMADYPLGLDHKGKPGGRVATVSDSDGDGKFDRRIVFAEGLETANTVLPWRDGALVVAPPAIWFMRDGNGDGIADERKILYEGFGRGNEQHRVNGLAWGLDGWIYVANGDSGGTVRSKLTGKQLALGGSDLRIRPDTGELERATGRTQHGRNRDDWGNWVAGNNSNAWQIVLEDRYIRKNTGITQPNARNPITGVIDLYPASRVLSHWSGYRPPPAGSPGRLTSGCGYLMQRGSLFEGVVKPSVYFSCPVHNCIHREVIEWDGVLMKTTRAEDEREREFLRSKDSWFRPTAIRHGPDGALYVADMYRMVIEHPEWIDKGLTGQMIEEGSLRPGHDKGRIYRIWPEGRDLQPVAKLSGMNARQLAGAIDSGNAWQRDTAHMMLTWLDEKGRSGAEEPLRKTASAGRSAAARVQALSALADLGFLNRNDFLSGMQDDHPEARRNVLRVAPPFPEGDAKIVEGIIRLLGDEDLKVRREAAYALGSYGGRKVGRALGEFLIDHAGDPYLRVAALSSSAARPQEVLLAVLEAEESPHTALIVNELVQSSGAESKELLSGILEIFREDKLMDAWKIRVLAKVVETVGKEAKTEPRLKGLFDLAWKIAIGNEHGIERRIASLELIGLTDLADAERRKALLGLLGIHQPAELQVASGKALLAKGEERNAKEILKDWKGYGPSLRRTIMDETLKRRNLTLTLLRMAAKSDELRGSIDLPRRQLLLTYEDDEIRRQAKEILGGSSRTDRKEVLRRYASTVEQVGDRLKGKALFLAHCSSCHRLDGAGKALGPDLSALGNRAPQAYLTAILDPNQGVSGNWIQFVAETKDGLSIVGSVTEETSSSVTMVSITGERTSLARRNLVSLVSTGRSFMPEGLESVISVRQMPDLLAYLQVAGEKRKVFANNRPELLQGDEEGAYRLPAASAEIYGPSIVFEQKYRNLGFWSKETDRAEWTFQTKKEGTYEVWIDWALPDKRRTSKLNLTVSTFSLSAPVPGTGSWDKYQWGRMGKVELGKGVHRAIVRIAGPLRSNYLMDLREVRLIPQGSKAPEGGSEWKDSNAVDLSADR